MIPECVNHGGPGSVLRLDSVPRLETATPLPLAARVALRAWRARPGAILTVVDPDQSCYRARLTAGAGIWSVIPFQRLGRLMESPVAIEVYQALPEKERFELVLQKLTELGAARIVPMTTSRSATLAERDAGQKKSHRWPEVLLRAARQCRRAMIPELGPVLDWPAVLEGAAGADLKLIFYEGEGTCELGAVCAARRPDRVALLVGPEGGFAPEEVTHALVEGFTPVSLGPRILRTETAAIAAVAVLQYALGDLR